MGYSRIEDVYWHDETIRALAEPARYFMLYLITCPHGNRVGLFVLDPMYAASDLEWTRDQVLAALQELRDAGRILWHQRSRTVLVRYYLRHNPLANQSVVKGALNDLRSLPPTPLLGDLLDAIELEQRGPAGPVKSHYTPLADAVRVRLGIRPVGKTPDAGPDTSSGDAPPPQEGGNGVDTEDSHRAGHGAPHGAGHGAGHHGTRARARDLALPPPTLPSLSDPDPTDRGAHGGGEDGQNAPGQEDVAAARAAIVELHGGTASPVMIEGHLVGLGLELSTYRQLCAAGNDPPDVIAKAIGYLREETGLEPPVSLKAFNIAGVYDRCVGRVYKAEPVRPIDVELRTMPTAEEEATRQTLFAQLRSAVSGRRTEEEGSTE